MEAGLTVTTHVSRFPGEMIDLAAAVAQTLPPAIAPGETDPVSTDTAVVAVGGDGTLFEVINGLTRNRVNGTVVPVPLGQIPVGTGNSFIRDLDIHDPQEAVQAILGGNTRAVDLGILNCEAGEYHFINLLGAGFVSSVAHRARYYKRWGALSYVLGVIRETAILAAQDLVLTIDGKRIERTGHFVEICNSRYTGGKMMIAPDARIDDGLFDVVVMSRVTRRKLLSLFPAIFSGTHVQDRSVEVFRGRTVRVQTAAPWLLTPDGETFGATPITAEILPKAIRVFCP